MNEQDQQQSSVQLFGFAIGRSTLTRIQGGTFSLLGLGWLAEVLLSDEPLVWWKVMKIVLGGLFVALGLLLLFARGRHERNLQGLAAINYVWTSVASLMICLLCAAVQLYWGGQDHAGQFHADYLWANGNLGMSLFFLGPYLLLAMSALVAWRQRASRGVLMLTAALCGISVLAGWIDHDQYLRTPPERGTPQILGFLATPLLWLGGVIVLANVGIKRSANLRSSSQRQPVTGPGP